MPLRPAVLRAIAAPFNTPEESAALKLRHGLFVEADLASPRARAAAAILRGSYDDASLSSPDAAPLDRAEAALWQGNVPLALQITGDLASIEQPAAQPISPDAARAIHLRAQALELAGQSDAAAKLSAQAVSAIRSGGFADGLAGPHLVRAAVLHYRLAGTPAAKTDFERLMSALAASRRLDPLEPLVSQVEAELLYDRDNFAQAQAALAEAMSLRAGAAESIVLLGQLVTSAFDIPQAELIAQGLGELTIITRAVDESGGFADLKEADADAAKPEVRGGPSVLASLLRARAMLRQNDPDLADAALNALPALLQGGAQVQAYRAAISAVRYDFDTTEIALTAFDKSFGRAPLALLTTGKALAEARQYERAAIWLKAAMQRAPYWNQPAVDLGLLYVQSGQDELAQLTLEAAFKLDPFNVRADNSLRLMKQLRGFTRSEGRHFVVRSTPGVNTMLASEMLPLLDAMHTIVTGPGVGLMHEPPGKTIIDLMPSHAQFAVRIAGIARIHTIAASTGPIIAMEVPRDGRGSTGTYDWLRVVRHEYTHTVGLSKTNNRLPHWFTEAQAVYLEQGQRDMRSAELLAQAFATDSLFDFTEINLAFTRPKKPSDRSLAYAQGHWMYTFIVAEKGADAPRALMQQFAKGVREAEAFESVLGMSREIFFEKFLIFAKADLTAWGMLPSAGQPSMKELLATLGERKEATIAQLEEWLAANPGHPDVLEALVLRTLAAGDGTPTEALRPLLEQYAQARPVDSLPHRHLAALAESAGDLAAAAEHLQFVDAREENSPAYAARLSELYARQGRWPDAWGKAQRATTIAPFVPAYRELAAAAAIQLNQLEDAERHLRFLAALEPDRPKHQQRLEALEKLKR